MNVCIRVKMKSEYIYDMLLYHMYSQLSGFLINMTGLTLLIMGGMWLKSGKLTPVHAAGYLLMGVAVLIYTPFSLKAKANKMMKEPKYQEEIPYQFDCAGVLEQISGNEVRYEWSQVERAVATPKNIVFYMEGSTVLVFPKEFFQADFMAFVKLIVANMSREQVYIR